MVETIVPEIVITHPGDRRLARIRWDDIGYEQSDPLESEPIYIVVPQNSTAEKIQEIADRFNVPVKTLEAARRAAPPVIPDPQQQVDFFPRRTGAENDQWFEFFYATRTLYRVQGNGMASRYFQNQLVWGLPLDRPLAVDEEVIVHLRNPDWLAPICLLRQINAVTDTQIELVDCYRCDRITIERSDIAAVEIAIGAPDLERFDYIAHEPRVDDDRPLPIGCWLKADVPQWLRHSQIGKPFLGPDRSRNPWSDDEAAVEA